eukprot:m.35124 g.35124  ORF g.35124 m.35124 type:complete len:357 (+) comp17087_c0_seq1:238-1308(+)
MAGSQAAREAARVGRIEQLSLLKDYEDGKEVTIKVHNKPTGYTVSKAEVGPPPKKNTKLKFMDSEILHDVIVQGDLEQVNALIDRGIDVNLSDPDGLTALHRACTENYLNIASALVNHGASVKKQDNDWWTPLHAAANAGNWRICNLLLTNGADPHAVNAEGDLAIDLVAEGKVEKVILAQMNFTSEEKIEEHRASIGKKMLKDVQDGIESKIDFNKQFEFGSTLLHVACCNGYVDVVQLLLDQDTINPNVKDENGNTPLHTAVFFCQYECTMYLVAKGADMKATNHLRQKPIVMSEDATMIRLLTALEKKTDQVKQKLTNKPRFMGSISRAARGNKGASRKDIQGEGHHAYNHQA